MTKNSVGEWDETASNNLDIGGINIAEGMNPGAVNNAIRTMMAQIATLAPKGTTELDEDYQPLNATLTSVAALGTAAGKYIYTTGEDEWAEADITAAGRAFLGAANASARQTAAGFGTAALMGDSDDTDFSNDPNA